MKEYKGAARVCHKWALAAKAAGIWGFYIKFPDVFVPNPISNKIFNYTNYTMCAHRAKTNKVITITINIIDCVTMSDICFPTEVDIKHDKIIWHNCHRPQGLWSDVDVKRLRARFANLLLSEPLITALTAQRAKALDHDLFEALCQHLGPKVA